MEWITSTHQTPQKSEPQHLVKLERGTTKVKVWGFGPSKTQTQHLASRRSPFTGITMELTTSTRIMQMRSAPLPWVRKVKVIISMKESGGMHLHKFH